MGVDQALGDLARIDRLVFRLELLEPATSRVSQEPVDVS
jgi:hypothetical protein